MKPTGTPYRIINKLLSQLMRKRGFNYTFRFHPLQHATLKTTDKRNYFNIENVSVYDKTPLRENEYERMKKELKYCLEMIIQTVESDYNYRVNVVKLKTKHRVVSGTLLSFHQN